MALLLQVVGVEAVAALMVPYMDRRRCLYAHLLEARGRFGFAVLLLHAWLVAVAVDCHRYCPLPLVLVALLRLVVLVVLVALLRLAALAVLAVLLQLVRLAVLVVLLELLVALSQLVALVVLLQMELLVSLVAMAVSQEAEQWATLVADEAADQMKALLASLQLLPQMDQRQMCPLVLQADHHQVLRHRRQSQGP